MKKQFTKFFLLFIILFSGCYADLYTKRLVMNTLKDGSTAIIVDGFIELSYTENTGMVFGVFGNKNSLLKHTILTGLTFISILFVLYILRQLRKLSFFYHLPFFMILSGAFGNLIDRIRLGYVIDFIHIHWKDAVEWPFLFNVADVLIVIGEILLLGLFIFKRDVLRSVLFRSTSKAEEN